MSSNYDKLTNGLTRSTVIYNNDINNTTAQTEKPLEKSNNISFEEWQTPLLAKYNVLQDSIKTSIVPLPQLPLPLEFALSRMC